MFRTTLMTAAAAALTLASGAAAQEQGAKPAAKAPKAMVSSGHPLVTQAMIEVLKKGGNAMDAALTGAILQNVVEPQMVSLAGALTALYYDAKTKQYYYLDADLDHTAKGAPTVPGWAQVTGGPLPTEATSGQLVAVPGAVAGLKAAADKFGTLKWSQYFQPAIKTAEQGFPMYSFLYGEMADAALGRLSAYPSGREEFLPNGYVPPVGSNVQRPRLAATMRRLANEGPDYFYTGDFSRRFVAEVQKTGGSLSQEDMAGYKVRWIEPLRFTYKGREIISAPPPGTAGALMAVAMNVVEPWDLKAGGHYTQSAESLFKIRSAFGFAEDMTDGFIQDPETFNVPTSVLTSKAFSAQLTALIDGSMPKVAATKSAAAENDALVLAGGFDHSDVHASDTDHIIVADAQGNIVSLTHSVMGATFATGLVVDGVVVNGGNYFPGRNLAKGRRVVSGFAPTMVAEAGVPTLAIGSPGLTSRAIALTLINHYGYDMPLEQAVDAARFQGSQQGRAMSIEGRITDEVRAQMKELYGVTVKITTPYNWHFGSIHAAAKQPDGTWLGVADPRRGGFAAGY
ncbi:gamma-glutamyltransferase [Caulobacter segnis]|uniref:gamma-glutamyltransferase family protein n=1 Tax=Caulobacter segnis TaxID=88688 RepID=UPI00240EB787|nr:gamma-glutamyltransferase [Caulobacter segnis]MDG2520203.1 gamma-glutamyltransferase [Caulobacter segnis]